MMTEHDFFSEKDVHSARERYGKRFKEYGISPHSLGWNKGKQNVRFDVLTSQNELTGKKILDIGCGFGDLYAYLSDQGTRPSSYTGIDIVPEFIDVAKQQHPQSNAEFFVGEFHSLDMKCDYDYVIASGIFNHKLTSNANYEFIDATIRKALSVCKEGIAFDFLSDKVDFQLNHTFHSAPETILSLAYKYSRNIVLRNDYMPFEFALFIFKDDGFLKEDTLFNRIRNKYTARSS